MNKFKVNQVFMLLSKCKREKREKIGEFYYTATFYDSDTDTIEKVFITEEQLKDLQVLKNYRVVGEVSFYNDKKRLNVESIILA